MAVMITGGAGESSEDEVVAVVPPTIVLWSMEECARELRMAPVTLKRLGKRGPPKIRLAGRVWYRPAGVEAWLIAREK